MTAAHDLRLQALQGWLARLPGQLGLRPDSLRPASADASFRRYFRLDAHGVAGGTAIAMDAPPPQEDTRPFLHGAAPTVERTRVSKVELVRRDTLNFIEPPKQGPNSPRDTQGAPLKTISYAQQQEIKGVIPFRQLRNALVRTQVDCAHINSGRVYSGLSQQPPKCLDDPSSVYGCLLLACGLEFCHGN